MRLQIPIERIILSSKLDDLDKDGSSVQRDEMDGWMINDDGYKFVAYCFFCYYLLAPYLPYYYCMLFFVVFFLFSFYYMVVRRWLVVGCVVWWPMPKKARDGIFRGGLRRGLGSSYQVIIRTA